MGLGVRLTVDRVGVLLEHGLTEYQARVYLALLDFPALNAGALAKASQIPRNRLYEVLEELQALGLVEIILDETRKYRALPLALYLDRSVNELKDRILRIQAQREYLGAAFQPPAMADSGDLEAGATRVLLTRRAVAREIERVIDGTQRSLLLQGSAGGWERVIRHMEKAPAALAKPGAVEIYLPRSAAQSGGSERLPPEWARAVRWIDIPLRTILVIADEREMVLVHPIPDDDRLRIGRDFGIVTDNSAFIRDRMDLVRKAASAEK
ncbi:MAG TPA: helix-turn-helix domain-containing protein [Candidatus Thermoplasmatota archaeon]|nr:helix-turn-helix domain-containing protein [Candidatus Thermoplasmatota archaeon]